VFELPDDSSQSVSQQSCIIAWDDLIDLEEVKGWEEDYIYKGYETCDIEQ
jgi:hypothetical protein